MSKILIIFLLLSSTWHTHGIKVKVGHIGAVNAMPKAEAILDICRLELWKEGILSEDFDIEY